MVLIDSWFSDKTAQIQRSLSTNIVADLEGQLLKTGGRVYQPKDLEQEDDQQKIVRSGLFRRIVTSVYGFRCAFCGLQIFNNSDNIVDSAHIKPFAQFYDDRISNGLSLCKNHHWAFDRFWFTLNQDYTIRVAEQLHETSPHGQPMQSFAGRPIYLPANPEYYPSEEAIAWHHQTFNERQGA
jgi:putative restriction endonuclease